ncbi:DUF6783 domain-containing protein [Blautia sp. HCP3S3_C4]|uniref:DUF6783 domain-containing protein n=1 Tax=Blautia sp. HCP3S3_C4 TaxID=3438911 RepID=UPI003F8B205F
MCGRFCPNEGVVAGYGNRIRAKYTTKLGVQIVRMIFQTHSSILCYYQSYKAMHYRYMRQHCFRPFFLWLQYKVRLPA